MTRACPLQLKIATEDWEFEEIHYLNYRTFVVEIPQHPPNDTQRLVDRFHAENTYFVAVDGPAVVGMVAFRAQRPFSLDSKLPDLDTYLPVGCRPCEIRLLAIDPPWRSTRLCRQLLAMLAEYAYCQGHDVAVISGTTRQIRLYEHLGFEPFGPLVGSWDALYQPMQLSLETFLDHTADVLLPARPRSRTVNLLPGPVAIAPHVAAALATVPLSHRSEEFQSQLCRVQAELCRLTSAKHAAVLLGSGTLANDVVAGQLSLRDEPGLILSNGEFGERLLDHGRRWGLKFDDLRLPWGEAFPADVLRKTLEAHPQVRWLWAVHGETSTGMLNDLEMLKNLCAERSVDLYADCISTVGLVPVDLHGVRMATAVSGKGLAAYPGLAIVFAADIPASAPTALPRFLDVGLVFEHGGVPFTHSSNLLGALAVALNRNWSRRFSVVTSESQRVRDEALRSGLRLVTSDPEALPGVLTIALPYPVSARELGEKLEHQGVQIAFRSEYMLSRNWIQICLMGHAPDVRAALEVLSQAEAAISASAATATSTSSVVVNGPTLKRTVPPEASVPIWA